MLRLEVTLHDVNTRLDVFLTKSVPHLSRHRAKQWLREGRVRVNERVVRTGIAVQLHDCVVIDPRERTPSQPIALSIVYEDESLLVAEKPPCVHMHALDVFDTYTFVDLLLDYCPNIQGIGFGGLQSGILHRLDYETSGLVLVAKTQPVFDALHVQAKQHFIQKHYWAFVCGSLNGSAVIRSGVVHHPTQSERMMVDVYAQKYVETHYTVVQHYGTHTWLDVKITQGARHQIRVHMASLGHPLVGDTLYATTYPFSRHALHAYGLDFQHPVQDRAMLLRSDMPQDLIPLQHA